MTIAVVRTFIPDIAQYDRALATADGGSLEFQVANYPVVTASEKVYVNGVLKATPADYSMTADIGLVTFVVAPVLSAIVLITYRYTIFSDATITTFLTAEGNNDKRATALALETMASDSAYTQKVMKLLDIQTDGAKVSDALLKRAAMLRAQADLEDAGTDGGFDWAEMVVDDFSLRERVIDEALRDG